MIFFVKCPFANNTNGFSAKKWIREVDQATWNFQSQKKNTILLLVSQFTKTPKMTISLIVFSKHCLLIMIIKNRMIIRLPN
jgi:hypothetical protein